MSNRNGGKTDLTDGSFNLLLCFNIKRISIKKSLQTKKNPSKFRRKYQSNGKAPDIKMKISKGLGAKQLVMKQLNLLINVKKQCRLLTSSSSFWRRYSSFWRWRNRKISCSLFRSFPRIACANSGSLCIFHCKDGHNIANPKKKNQKTAKEEND